MRLLMKSVTTAGIAASALLGLASVTFTPTPAEAVVYCQYVDYPPSCVARAGVVLRPRPVARAAVRAWGLPTQCADERVHSPVLTGVVTPIGVDADALRRTIHDRFDLSLGAGLGKLKGRMFRIGHLGDSNDLTLMAALAGVEMGLKLAGVPLAGSGVSAAMEFFAATHSPTLEP